MMGLASRVAYTNLLFPYMHLGHSLNVQMEDGLLRVFYDTILFWREYGNKMALADNQQTREK